MKCRVSVNETISLRLSVFNNTDNDEILFTFHVNCWCEVTLKLIMQRPHVYVFIFLIALITNVKVLIAGGNFDNYALCITNDN